MSERFQISRKNIAMLIATFVIFILILFIGPMDFFSHGYFCQTVEWNKIYGEDFLEYVDITEQEFVQQFVPQKRHFAGFELNCINLGENSEGTIKISIYNEDNTRKIDETVVDISEMTAGEWYRVDMNKSLRKGEIYSIRISNVDCLSAPYLQIIDPDYLSGENLDGNLLIGYGYEESTFLFSERVLISIILSAIWLGILAGCLKEEWHKKICFHISVFLLMSGILSWNFMFNTMDNKNTEFDNFSTGSQSLVTNAIKAQQKGIASDSYGLGTYIGIDVGMTEMEWVNGYSTTEPRIRLIQNEYTDKGVKNGKFIQFKSGDCLEILNVTEEDGYYIITLQSDRILFESKYGSLYDIRFLTSDQQVIENGVFDEYVSQYGLQGKVFSFLSNHMKSENIVSELQLITSILAAAVFSLIVIVLFYKYNALFAGCFFITFWLSSWVVNFARNLYWQEFTWFLPMLIGLFCSWKIENKKYRVISYIGIFFAILIKCLCGYEFITTVMLGSIAFLLVDFIEACLKQNINKAKILFKSIFIIGVLALIGFGAALVGHALLRGEGNILEGIKSIYEQDVLRRTLGGNPGNFMSYDSENLIDSLNASIWEVILKYFSLPTEILVGIPGNLFPLVSMIPIAIFIYNYWKKEDNDVLPIMYIVFLITTLSWYILGKSHSYLHGHRNYVLWYFGFVQICIYTICRQVLRYKDGKRKNNE